MGDKRPGDNLYTSSTIAVDVATGKIKGHFQYDPNESWDWDEVSPPILVDFKRGSRTYKGLIDAGRDGYLWFLERSTGRINFVEGKPFVHQESLDAYVSELYELGTDARDRGRCGVHWWH